jgi:RNA polymerase sigma-70 factor (ECF subfamily)
MIVHKEFPLRQIIFSRLRRTMRRMEIADRIAAERDYLVSLASRQLRNRERSEDVVQSTLLAALAAARGFRGAASLRTWLTAILNNRIVDEQRRAGREPLAADLASVAPPAPGMSLEDPAAEAQARQALGRVQTRLDSLPGHCPRAFAMREFQGRSSREIKARLRLTPSQLWQCLYRVRRELRAELGSTHARS